MAASYEGEVKIKVDEAIRSLQRLEAQINGSTDEIRELDGVTQGATQSARQAGVEWNRFAAVSLNAFIEIAQKAYRAGRELWEQITEIDRAAVEAGESIDTLGAKLIGLERAAESTSNELLEIANNSVELKRAVDELVGTVNDLAGAMGGETQTRGTLMANIISSIGFAAAEAAGGVRQLINAVAELGSRPGGIFTMGSEISMGVMRTSPAMSALFNIENRDQQRADMRRSMADRAESAAADAQRAAASTEADILNPRRVASAEAQAGVFAATQADLARFAREEGAAKAAREAAARGGGGGGGGGRRAAQRRRDGQALFAGIMSGSGVQPMGSGDEIEIGGADALKAQDIEVASELRQKAMEEENRLRLETLEINEKLAEQESTLLERQRERMEILHEGLEQGIGLTMQFARAVAEGGAQQLKTIGKRVALENTWEALEAFARAPLLFWTRGPQAAIAAALSGAQHAALAALAGGAAGIGAAASKGGGKGGGDDRREARAGSLGRGGGGGGDSFTVQVNINSPVDEARIGVMTAAALRAAESRFSGRVH